MKLTESMLKQMVKEELRRVLREADEQNPDDLPTVKTGTGPEQRRDPNTVTALTDKIIKELNGKSLRVTPKVGDKPVNLVVNASRDQKQQAVGMINIDISSKQKHSDIGLKPMPAMMGGDRAAYKTYYRVNVGVNILGPHSKIFIEQGTREVGKVFPTAAAILQAIEQDIASGKSTPV